MAQTNVVQVAVLGLVGGRPTVNLMDFVASGGDPALTAAAVDGLRDAWYLSCKTVILPLLSTGFVYKGAQAREIGVVIADPNPPPAVKFTPVYTSGATSTNDAGAVASDSLASFAAVNVQKKTASGDRAYRGSWHQAGLPEDYAVVQYVKSSEWAIWRATFLALFTTAVVVTVGAATWNFYPVVFTRTYALEDGIGTLPYGYTRYIIDAPITMKIGSMLRRKTKVNP